MDVEQTKGFMCDTWCAECGGRSIFLKISWGYAGRATYLCKECATVLSVNIAYNFYVPLSEE